MHILCKHTLVLSNKIAGNFEELCSLFNRNTKLLDFCVPPKCEEMGSLKANEMLNLMRVLATQNEVEREKNWQGTYLSAFTKLESSLAART
jgi:hypothetical protein